MARSLIPILQTICGALGNRGRNLGRREANEAFQLVLEGEGTAAQIAALMVGLRSRGATADELTGCAEASRDRIEFPEVPEDGVVIATSRLGKRNTPPMGLAAAVTASAAGVPVLVQASVHADGSGLTLGDLWEHVAGPLTGDTAAATHRLNRAGIAAWSPTKADESWERLLEIESEIALRSLPDVVTKLLAPKNSRLIVAAMPGPVLGTAGDSLAMLGHRCAMIIQGVEGSIDPYLTQMTRGMLLEENGKSPLRVQPEDLALSHEFEASFPHEDRLQAAMGAMMEAFLATPGPNLNATLLGAALIIRLSGRARDVASAVGLARDAIESGKAHHAFETIREPSV